MTANGKFTYGARFICWKPTEGEYQRLAMVGPDMKADSEAWNDFGEQVTNALNSHRDMLAALAEIASTLDLESYPGPASKEYRLGSLAREAIAKATGAA